MNELGNEILSKVKVTLAFVGYGRLTLTDKCLIWNKSATSFFAFGAFAAATDNHVMIPISDMVKVGKYMCLTGGLLVTTNTGKEYKIAFNQKKHFLIVYNYLNKVVNGQ